MNFVVINLKKNTLTFIFLIFTLLLILFSENNLIAAKNGFLLFANNVLPALFPFFIATEILYKTNINYILSKVFSRITKPLFNVPGQAASAIILGMISGYPIGAKIVCSLKKDKLITNVEAERLIAYTNNSSPLFILSTVGISLYNNSSIGYKLLFIHIISSLIVGILFRFWKYSKKEISINRDYNGSKTSLIKLSNLGEILSDAIKNSISSLLLICGFIVIFSIIISILELTNFFNIFSNLFSIFNVPPEASKSILTGIIEMTNGINLSSKIVANFSILSIMITSFLLGFGGLSIMMQIYSLISKESISIKPYFYGKTLQGLISSILILLII